MIDPRMLQAFLQRMPMLAQQNSLPGAPREMAPPQAFGAPQMMAGPAAAKMQMTQDRGPMPGNGKRYGVGGMAAPRASAQGRRPIMGRPVRKQPVQASGGTTVGSALRG
jgi:hypothetical protein